MELTDLIPKEVTLVKILSTEEGEQQISLTLRKFDLEDESWIKSAYPNLKEVFDEVQMEPISRIAFHQLTNKSKLDLMKIKFEQVTEEGEIEEICKTGPQKLRKITVGFNDQIELLKAILETRGLSMPVVEEISKTANKEANELGKRMLQAQEKK